MSDPHKILRSQIRASRELLEMAQTDLSERLGITRSKLSRAENGDTKSSDILLEIKDGLEKIGVRFTKRGVEIADNYYEIIEGEGCYLKLLHDVYNTLNNEDDKTLKIMFARDMASPPEVNNQYRFMRKHGIKMRQLIQAKDNEVMGELDEYRTIPEQYFTNLVTLIYANKIAQVNSDGKRIVIQCDKGLAIRENKIFEWMWSEGKTLEISMTQERF